METILSKYGHNKPHIKKERKRERKNVLCVYKKVSSIRVSNNNYHLDKKNGKV